MFQLSWLAFAVGLLPVLFWKSTTFYFVFNAHPFGMSLAFALAALAARSFHVQRQQSTQSNGGTNRKATIQFHQTIVSLSQMCMLTGLGSILYSKFANNRDHFTSYHSIVGMVACVMALGAGSMAYIAYNNPTALRPLVQAMGWKSVSALWPYHRLGGLAVLSTYFAAMVLGVYTDWMERQLKQLHDLVPVTVPVMRNMVLASMIGIYLPLATQVVKRPRTTTPKQ